MPDLNETDQEPTDEQLDVWARDVENMMSKCSNGQPYDEGEPVWLNQHGPLEDALETADIQAEYYEEVADRVRCSCCGNSYELYDEVGLKTQQELRFEDLHAQWLDEHQHRDASAWSEGGPAVRRYHGGQSILYACMVINPHVQSSTKKPEVVSEMRLFRNGSCCSRVGPIRLTRAGSKTNTS